MLFLRSLTFAATLCITSTAFAHLYVTDPVARHGRRDIKDGPCGITGGTRSDNINYFRPGQTITITFDEYVGHPGHYRIAFDDDGDDFEDPVCVENCDDSRSGPPSWAPDDTGMVLMDLIPDRSGTTTYEIDVTLPDIECDNCTLQVIQVMYDKFPYTIGGNDNYYNCIDLVLTNDPDFDAGTDPDAGPGSDAGPSPDGAVGSDAATGTDAGGGGADAGEDTGGGGCSAAGSTAGALWLLSLVALRRREGS